MGFIDCMKLLWELLNVCVVKMLSLFSTSTEIKIQNSSERTIINHSLRRLVRCSSKQKPHPNCLMMPNCSHASLDHSLSCLVIVS